MARIWKKKKERSSSWSKGLEKKKNTQRNLKGSLLGNKNSGCTSLGTVLGAAHRELQGGSFRKPLTTYTET